MQFIQLCIVPSFAIHMKYLSLLELRVFMDLWPMANNYNKLIPFGKYLKY